MSSQNEVTVETARTKVHCGQAEKKGKSVEVKKFSEQ